ncbi:FYN-binding protein 1 [Ctenopharyngodon idella]|uniref:FYN-binding protein 1 n=1 Tax=Ctenopharyngodon idella TaxID=7959 RepID=UPI00222E4260|nr:FYN-binding protein 1 [Ctenopharyngodon idella]
MATATNVQALMSHFNSPVGEGMFSQPNQSNQFSSSRTDDQNPLLAVKLRPVVMNKGAGSRPTPKPLMVKPNFTVNSLETRINPPLSNNKANVDSRSDAVGAKLPSRGQQENSYTQAPTAGAKPWSPAKPPVMQKPVLHKDISAAPGTATDDLSVPKKKLLPSVFALGKCPAKPKRPPHVNLNKFRGNGSSVSNTNNPEVDPEVFPLPPPPPPERLLNTSMPPPPPPDITFPPAPPLMDPTLQEDYYDDTDTVMNRTQTSLGKSSNDPEESDEEMYEDLDHNWPENNKETKEEKTTKESKELKKKLEKEEKKRLEQEKKEKKEREKRQQEARKKFKIKGTIEVVDTVKATVDHKGGKNKLPLKQGETIEIVRKTDNPKDYWLARNTEGHYGFVKPDTLDVCGEVRHTQDGQEVYDDVGGGDEVMTAFECDEDIYECAEDTQADFSFPPPPPLEFNGVDATDDTYDDVNPTDFPPPPPPDSIPVYSSTSKTNEMDPKKKKKFEKEEKEFRKKFKYNAEIKVLYQATILQSLSIKKFGSKDLPIKPGEMIDVIVHPVDDKIIGRNSEGKFGYVSTANLEQDGSVYDDVGDECIYDND